ncbi:MAG TPA: Ig-like domain-containing protein [Planctomycetota bacterium]|nr:Ig-like domain-containing protein [Planctomycetota bacterium]
MNMPRIRPALLPWIASAATLALGSLAAQGPPRILAWNDLGMHCTDNDTSVFSILPPYNNFHAQIVIGGHLVTNGSYTVTYQATADAHGSINTTSIGKTDFWQHVQALFGVSLPPDTGLAGFQMPGAANTPRAMAFHAALSNYIAEGVPVTPYDDTMALNPYPLMRLVARNGSGQVVATTDAVVPVSAEVACVGCHGSGGNPAARPTNGWVFGPSATDDRLNILKLHDDRQLGTAVYATSLQAVGYSSNGLYYTAVNLGTPVLCARCHGSNALGAAGQPGVQTMTGAMHTLHAQARLADGRRLDDVMDRTSCYTCHPGARTRCLRGAMGKAIGGDGEPMMACQDCHGSMSAVGNPARVGWLEEPNCQNCHTGDAVQNAGAIRFDHAFDAPGHLRTTTNQRFATDPDAPQTGFSLYRFSTGHGELECSACHGSPHAIWPANEDNDNVQSIAAQGHKGTIVECSTCHSNLQDNQLIGPHGMHPTGSSWVGKHQDIAEQQGTATCRVCHGTSYRGTVLSRSQGDRTITTQFGTKTFWRGYEVGCYDCHNGPSSENASPNTPPSVQNRTEATPTDTPLLLTLAAADPNAGDTLTLRIVEQPRHGAVAFDGTHATYRAWDDYVGPDSFTYAAGDTRSNSNLGTVSITVQARACAGSSETFGFGCAGSTGLTPALHLDGCPMGGNTVVLQGDHMPATSFAIVALGVGRGTTELLPNGCVLRLATLISTTGLLPVTLGQFSLPVAVPAGLGVWDATTQSFCLDPTEPSGFLATPGLEIHFR